MGLLDIVNSSNFLMLVTNNGISFMRLSKVIFIFQLL